MLLAFLEVSKTSGNLQRCPGVVRPKSTQVHPFKFIRTSPTPSCYLPHLDSGVEQLVLYFIFKREGANWFYADDCLNRRWEYVNSFSHCITNVTLFTKLMLMLDWPAAFIARCIPRAFTTPTSQWTPERRRKFLDCPLSTLPFGPRNRLFAFL